MSHSEIIVDAMGGDHAPQEIIKGAAQACLENDAFKCIFVGDEAQIAPLIKKEKIPADRWEIVHTPDWIAMDDHPKEAVENKPNASISVAARMIRDGRGDALMSAGSTGATIIACSKEIPKMHGVERGVLAAVFPAMKQKKEDPGVAMMLDVGATIHCTVNQLVSFAYMGIHYMKEILDIENPRVGLLNIGEEDSKGHSVLVETNKTLRNLSGMNFIGNVEGKDIMRGTADVIVTEGITGNIVLKSIEGMAEMSVQTGKQIWKKNIFTKMGLALLSPTLKKLKKRLDYSEYGGVPFLGFSKLVIKAHGRSEAKAIKNAILTAEVAASKNVIKSIENSMKTFYMSMFEDENEQMLEKAKTVKKEKSVKKTKPEKGKITGSFFKKKK